VHLPIVFAIYSQLRAYGLKLKSARNKIYEELERIKQANPLLRRLKRSEIKEKAEKLQDLDTKITTVEENMSLLAEELQQVSLYLSGKEVTADV
jgi:uncharacterized protein YacL (UPF0231 family)